MIQNEEDLLSKEFQSEILSFGYVKFYKGEKLCKIIECNNNQIIRPPNYNCFLLEGKNIFYINLYYIKYNLI